jgi:DNA-binding CsgD family transcriptional regulator
VGERRATRGPALVERDGELARVHAAVGRAVAGAGGAVLLEGSAGSGKTALLRALAPPRGALVRRAVGAELERDVPFGVVRQLLEEPVLGLADAERETLLDGPAGGAGPILGLPGEAPQVPDQQLALAHALWWVVARLAERSPLLLSVDDLHWADGASLRALAYLAPRLEDHPIALVLAVRSEAVGEPLIADIAHGCELVSLQALSEAGTATLVRRELGRAADDRFCAACHRATGGLPELVVQLTQAAHAEGLRPDREGAAGVERLVPRSLWRSALTWIARLGPEATELAGAVAVLEQAEARHAAALAGVDPGNADRACAALVRSNLLEPGLPLRFRHPLIREAVYADLAPTARERAHRRAAELLAPTRPAAAAAHLQRCEPGGEAWAVEALREAGEDAVRRGAPAAAARLLARAREEDPAHPDRVRLGLLEGLAKVGAGLPDGLEVLRSAVAAADPGLERSGAAMVLGQAQVARGDMVAALRTLRGAFDDAPSSLAPAAFGSWATLARGHPDGVEQVRELFARRIAAGGLDALDAVEAGVMAFHAALEGEPDAATVRALAGRALADPETLRAARPFWPVYQLAVWALATAGDAEGAQRGIDELFEDARATGSRFQHAAASHMASWVTLKRGLVAETLGHCAEVTAVAREGWGMMTSAGAWARVPCSLVAGDPAGADEAIALAEAHTSPDDEDVNATWLLAARALRRLAAGDAAGAWADARAAGEKVAALRIHNPAASAWREVGALACADLGDRATADELLDGAERAARRFGEPSALALTLGVRARVGHADAIAVLEEASALASEGPSLLVQAGVMTELGAQLRRARHPRDAREPLRAGLDAAVRAGAPVIAGRARSELEATGARLQRERLSGPEALTPRELQLCRLAAEGRSNVEIAERLFIARRTVETHLTSAYTKLGIASRDELRAALDD